MSQLYPSFDELLGHGNSQLKSMVSDQTSETFRGRNFGHNIIDHDYLLTQAQHQTNMARRLNEALSHIHPQKSVSWSRIRLPIHVYFADNPRDPAELQTFNDFFGNLDPLRQKR